LKVNVYPDVRYVLWILNKDRKDTHIPKTVQPENTPMEVIQENVLMNPMKPNKALICGLVSGILCLVIALFFVISYFLEAERYPKYKGQYVLGASHDIDMVVTWVDSSDANWQKQRDNLATKLNLPIQHQRYPSTKTRSDSELEVMLMSIHRFAPWLRHVFVITARPQTPHCLTEPGHETRFPKCKIVHHDEILPVSALPTFNSHVIESGLHNIPSLSEKFLYANDDMYATNHIFPGDYFQNGVPILHVSIICLNWQYDADNGFYSAWRNVNHMLRKTCPPFNNFPAHVFVPLTKTVFRDMWDKYGDKLRAMQCLPFRQYQKKDQLPPVGLAIFLGMDNKAILRHGPNTEFSFQYYAAERVLKPHCNICINYPTSNATQRILPFSSLPPTRRNPPVIIIGGEGYDSQEMSSLLLSRNVWWITADTPHVQRVVAALNMDANQEVIHWRPTVACIGELNTEPATAVVGPDKGPLHEQAIQLAEAMGKPMYTFRQQVQDTDPLYQMAVRRLTFKP